MALKCTFCNIFFKGSRPGGSTYKHLKRCAEKNNKNPAQIDAKQKENFVNHCFKLMCDNFMPSIQFNSAAFLGIIQNTLEIGFDCGRLQPKCLPPRVENLMFDRTTVVRKLEKNIVENYEDFRHKIREIVKKNSAAVVVDMISKQHHYYGVVIHFIDKQHVLRT